VDCELDSECDARLVRRLSVSHLPVASRRKSDGLPVAIAHVDTRHEQDEADVPCYKHRRGEIRRCCGLSISDAELRARSTLLSR